MNILVTGKNGQLGSEIFELQNESEHHFIFKTSSECDITDIENLEEVIQFEKIDAIINCAAYTAVDLAEDEKEKAFLVNHIGVQNIDLLASKYNFKYIHISTDYVFDGEKNIPYECHDEVSPLGVYGRSKRAGEEVVINSNSNSIVIRTSWLYSSFGNNFVKTILKYGRQKEKLGIVSDQFGSPTYARDLAKKCLEIINFENLSYKGKVYHYSNDQSTNWFEFTKEIFRIKKVKCELKPLTTEEYPTKTKRPKYSVLSTSKIKADFNLNGRNWKESLAECLSLIE